MKMRKVNNVVRAGALLATLPFALVTAESSDSSTRVPISSSFNLLPDSLDDLIERTTALRTHSLHAPYVDQDLQNRWWDFAGDAIINTNAHVRLTQDRQSEVGSLWSRMPIKGDNWVVEVEFKVDGAGGHHLHGDGFAVWLTRDRAKPGKVFGSADYFNGLGLFFDSYANSRHTYSFPRVTAMLGDGQTAYDHEKDNEEHEIDFRHRSIATKFRLIYLKDRALQLQTHVQRWDEWKTCFTIDNYALPAGDIFLGFTAATGEVSDAHDVVSVNFETIHLKQTATPAANEGYRIKADADQPRKKSKQSKKTSASSGGGSAFVSAFLFIVKAIGVLAFCAFAFAAYRTVDAQKKGKRF